jgi:long-chain acyl-CoA synthetase
MYPGEHARTQPEKIAYLMASTGETVTYAELDAASNQGAQLFRSLGLGIGDGIAIFMENNAQFFQICWAAQRSGLRYTAISSRLTAPEVEYIVKDCGAKVIVTSSALREIAEPLAPLLSHIEARYAVGEPVEGYASWEAAVADQPITQIDDEAEGADMLYSSGTTGRPKGVHTPIKGAKIGTVPALVLMLDKMYGIQSDSVYLSPAPLYHAAPLRFNMAMHRLGCTSVIMEHFDAIEALKLIEQHRVTHSQWVPTMFVRMLKLPEAERARFDVSSLECAIHAAAPCPVPIKREMIDWWGPVLHEYYAGTENNGFVAIDSHQWLTHPGSVGKPVTAKLHIVDDAGDELPVGETGTVYFEGGGQFQYHNAPDKTKDSYSKEGWSTLGDVGHVDAEGYLYLTDRKAFMIISGGVNIYPQEAENVLITHPRVSDVAVIGVPNEDFGEEVKAVVQPADMADAGPELERELLDYCQAQLSKVKCPRSIDFEAELPRHPTGKLYKRLLKDRYWGNHDSRIV